MTVKWLYQLSDIQHRYAARTILDLPTLDIARGEVLALVGPSGSGKTTLLRLLQFLEAPTHGAITFDGAALDGQLDLKVRRRVATVFQSPALLDRSVYDNVAYGLQLRGLRAAHDTIMAALERVGMQNLAKARARTLSGGEAQRVALARAIVLVTHNVFQAKRLADRVGLLLSGKLIELGTAEQFFSHPIDPRTRAFVNGEMVY